MLQSMLQKVASANPLWLCYPNHFAREGVQSNIILKERQAGNAVLVREERAHTFESWHTL